LVTSKEPGLLIASLSDSTVVLCDRELRILAVEGPAWPADVQPASADLRGRPLSEAIAPEPLARLQPCLDAALEGEAAYTEYGPDREDRSFAVQVLPLRLGADQVFGVLLVTRDVTAERRAELELLRSEAQLAQAQRIAHIGSWEWDLRSGEVTW
jgi:PAS domain-containing protein